jgi:hypothetical protein
MRRLVLFVFFLALGAVSLRAQMDLSQVSGRPLPSADLPAGTLTIRVVRGAITNNVAGQAVEVTVDGATRHLTTDASGHIQISDLKPGAHVKAVAVVDGQPVESQDITIGTTGIRVMLVAGLPAGAPGAPGASPAGPPVKGEIAFGPESRIVAELVDDRLMVYYLLDLVNSGSSPLDPGAPVVIDLPAEAHSAGLMQDSTKQAIVAGARVTVTAPFAPGSTPVRVAFELPTPSGTVHVSSKLSARLPQVIVILGQSGGLDLASPQFKGTRELTDQGQRIVVATGPGVAPGQPLDFDITGVPHHPTWPRYLALTLAGSLVTAGLWGAFSAPRRRKGESRGSELDRGKLVR